jgi:hypothetical protein
MWKQKMIVVATMVLHNYIREHRSGDIDFYHVDHNVDYESMIPIRYNKYVGPSDNDLLWWPPPTALPRRLHAPPHPLQPSPSHPVPTPPSDLSIHSLVNRSLWITISEMRNKMPVTSKDDLALTALARGDPLSALLFPLQSWNFSIG